MMKISGNTVLITGGATGIGLALAESFLKNENEVIICGRRADKLDEAKKKLPQLHTRICDVSDDSERRALFKWAAAQFPDLNILLNNAGIQLQIDLKKGIADFPAEESEIKINLEAPVYLSALFIQHLLTKVEPAIINVSSGLAFIPLTIVPVYCATKAGIHSFSMSLRHQLSKTPIRVFEIIPPTVDTELDRGARDRRGQAERGIKPSEVAAAAMKGIENDRFEIPVGMAEGLVNGSKTDPQKIFERMNGY